MIISLDYNYQKLILFLFPFDISWLLWWGLRRTLTCTRKQKYCVFWKLQSKDIIMQKWATMSSSENIKHQLDNNKHKSTVLWIKFYLQFWILAKLTLLYFKTKDKNGRLTCPIKWQNRWPTPCCLGVITIVWYFFVH